MFIYLERGGGTQILQILGAVTQMLVIFGVSTNILPAIFDENLHSSTRIMNNTYHNNSTVEGVDTEGGFVRVE